jgi:hypothetical protein
MKYWEVKASLVVEADSRREAIAKVVKWLEDHEGYGSFDSAPYESIDGVFPKAIR